jgi:hypothetical protein
MCVFFMQSSAIYCIKVVHVFNLWNSSNISGLVQALLIKKECRISSENGAMFNQTSRKVKLAQGNKFVSRLLKMSTLNLFH